MEDSLTLMRRSLGPQQGPCSGRDCHLLTTLGFVPGNMLAVRMEVKRVRVKNEKRQNLGS